jgi:hypothetical protein
VADITLGTSLAISRGLLSEAIYVNNVTASMNQTGFKSTTYTVNSAATTLSTANLNAVGYALFRNLSPDTVSTISVAAVLGTATISFSTLRPGEPGMLRLSSGTSYQATGAAGAILRVDITEG